MIAYDAILATGHVSKEEILAATEFAFGAGAKRVVITHPELATPKLDLPTMVQLAKAGAYMEFCAVNLLPTFYCLSLQGLIEAIEAVTPERDDPLQRRRPAVQSAPARGHPHRRAEPAREGRCRSRPSARSASRTRSCCSDSDPRRLALVHIRYLLSDIFHPLSDVYRRRHARFFSVR